ncbi:hypothetical protein D9619_003998 [Psilocybe cf. subviscida]|uniref:Uncharacterized protein n=1 Tax=Psilocybe cf. subviscida TaxID=2480587 RepID=A0A8H5BPR9_9AGAR|nr:hypothetical protein D9619_003998 [Psilocybe cf. subviscida]
MQLRFERNLFIPDCALTKMTTPELERAARGPDMWLALVANNPRDDNILEHLSRYTLTMPMPHIPKDKEMLPRSGIALRLAPGGNFLVGVSAVALCIWRLGPQHTGTGNPRSLQPISTARIEQKSEEYYGSVCDVLLERTTDGEGLRVALQYCDHWASRSVLYVVRKLEIHPLKDVTSRYTCSIYEIDLKSENPKFELLVSRPTPRRDITTRLYAMLGDIVLITMDGWEIVLWNFVENTWACWLLKEDFGFYSGNVLLTPEYVMIMGDDRLGIWKIPPLRDNPALGGISFWYDGYTISEQYLPPDFVCTLPAPPIVCSERRNWTWCAPHQWHNSRATLSSTFLGITTISDEWDPYTSITGYGRLGFLKVHHTLRLNVNERNHVNKDIPDSLKNGLQAPLYVYPPGSQPMFFSDSHSDNSTVVGGDPNRVEIYASNPIGRPSRDSEIRSMSMITTDQIQPGFYPKFSPAAGRLAFISKEHKIVVWDFLP